MTSRLSIVSRRFVAVLALILASLAGRSRANDFATAFDTANQLYVDGKFADAAEMYQGMLETGNLSEAILFNRGNALFRQGKIGEAILSYRQAQLLAPRDADLRANLQFARTRARGGAPYQASRWKAWFQMLTINEWTGAAVLSFWIFFALLAAGQWRKPVGARLRGGIVVLGVATLLICACLAVELSTDYFAQTAIVTAGETDVCNGPFDEAPSLYKVRDGVELEVLDRKDNWLQVADSAQRVGWVRRSDVVLFEPAAAAARRL